MLGGLLALAAITGGLPEDCLLGTPGFPVTARSLAMGRSEFMDPSPMGALANPSTAASAGAGLTLSASGGLDLGVEKRTRTVYDSFGSSIGEAEHSFDRTTGFLPGGMAAALSGLDGMPRGLGLAAGWRVQASFGYDWDREVRSEYYALLGSEALSISGTAGELCASASFSPLDAVSLGLGAGWLSCKREESWRQVWVDESVPDVLETQESDLEVVTVRAAVTARPSRRVAASAGFEAPLSAGWSGDADGPLDLPPLARAGFLWIPGNALRSTFTAEFSYRAMSGARFDGADMGLRDSWSASAGVENSLPGGGPECRFGFRYDRSPIARGLDCVSVTAGLGFDLDGWAVDAGGLFSPRTWEQVDVGSLPSFSDDDSLAVEETETILLLSLSRRISL